MIYANVEQYIHEYIASRLPLPGVDYSVKVSAGTGVKTRTVVKGITPVGVKFIDAIGDDLLDHIHKYEHKVKEIK